LGLASVEQTNATAWNVEVEVVAAEIAAGACGLNNHCLASDWPGGDFETI
jgi:hypothetical protein